MSIFYLGLSYYPPLLPSLPFLVLSPVTASARLKMNVKIDGDTSMPQVR